MATTEKKGTAATTSKLTELGLTDRQVQVCTGLYIATKEDGTVDMDLFMSLTDFATVKTAQNNIAGAKGAVKKLLADRAAANGTAGDGAPKYAVEKAAVKATPKKRKVAPAEGGVDGAADEGTPTKKGRAGKPKGGRGGKKGGKQGVGEELTGTGELLNANTPTPAEDEDLEREGGAGEGRSSE